MATVQARIRSADGHESVLPVVVPEMGCLREFAKQLHADAKPWQGEAFGWQAEYSPEQDTPPLESQLKFTPAEFCIGESGVAADVQEARAEFAAGKSERLDLDALADELLQ